MSKSVLGPVGREVADLSWNTVTKGKRSRKAMATSSESPKRVGDFSGSDKLCFSDEKAEFVPLKKRRSPSSKSPILSPKAMDMDVGASSKLSNGEFYSPDDFHGLALLAAAASLNTQQDVVAFKDKNQAQNACSESGKLQLQDEISVELSDVSSKVDRLLWDLNVPMEEWGKPNESNTFASQTTSLDKDDGVTVCKDDEESDAETVVLDLDQVENAEEVYTSKSSSEVNQTSEENREENIVETSEKVADQPEESDHKDGLAVSKDDEESDAETVDLNLVENAEEFCISKPSSEESKTSAVEELNHKEEFVETSKEIVETSKVLAETEGVDSSMLDIQAMPLDEDGVTVSGDKQTDVEAVPPVDQAENAEECYVSKSEENQNFNVGQEDVVETTHKLAEPESGNYDSLSEEGELKGGSMSNSWQENEDVDYESEEFYTDKNSVHDDADASRSPRKWRESENNYADDNAYEENLSNRDFSEERSEKTYDTPNFRDERDDHRHYNKGYNPNYRGRGRYHPYQSGYRGRGRGPNGPNRPRMSGPYSRDKYDQKPHYPNYHAKRDDRDRQMAYWEPPRYDRGPPMEDNGQSRSRNNGGFNKKPMDYPSKNMHKPAGWNRYQNNDRRNFRGRGYNNGGGRGFQKPDFADDYEDGYRSPPPPPPPPPRPPSRGRFTSSPRSFRGDHRASFRQRKPSYNNGFRQDQRFDSGEGFKSEDGSYVRNRRPPFNNNGFRGEQGGFKSDHHHESFRPDW